MPITLAISADPPYEQRLIERADELADRLGLSVRKLGEACGDLRLVVTAKRLELRVEQGQLAGGNAVYADLSKLDTTSPAGRSLNNPLFKAVGIKKGNAHRPRVMDCTAGLGEDAWLLAANGCTVDAYERQPVTAALLADALERVAVRHPEIAQRITLHQTDATARTGYLSSQSGGLVGDDIPIPDAIVLDPMFPQGRKAAERKPMRVLRLLAGDDDDADALLVAALATGVHRVAVKRPLHAPPLEAGRPPEVVHKGKAVRFDVYIQ
ncbi:MAG: class I SAM-dependent methyltransferase [Phycisphaerales bacterium JB063]